MDTTCYLVNQPPSLVFVENLHQAWNGNKLSLKHLKIFGVPKENRSKLDYKAEKCIFVAYKDGMKSYKRWNLVTKKIVYS